MIAKTRKGSSGEISKDGILRRELSRVKSEQRDLNNPKKRGKGEVRVCNHCWKKKAMKSVRGGRVVIQRKRNGKGEGGGVTSNHLGFLHWNEGFGKKHTGPERGSSGKEKKNREGHKNIEPAPGEKKRGKTDAQQQK